MKTKKTIFLTLGLAGAQVGALMAQEPEIDLEARKRTIPIIEQRVAERYAQISQLGSDILELHKRVDEKLGRMVERLAAVKDSVQSGFNVGNVKIEVIEALKVAAEAFQARRLALEKGLREGRSGIPEEILKNEIHHFDEHVEMHIEQMLKLSKSFTQDENVQRYVSVTGGDGGSYWDGIEVSDEWRQSQKDRSLNRKQREEVESALEDSIDRCKALIAQLKSELKKPGLSEIEQGLIKSEIDTHSQMLQKREMQMEELLVVKKPDTMEMSRDAADSLEEAVGELVDDIQRDVRTISLKHSQLSAEQAKLFALKANLEARKKWLEEYEAGGGR